MGTRSTPPDHLSCRAAQDWSVVETLVQVFTYRLNPRQAPAFQHVLGRFVEAAEHTTWPGRYIWIASISGGADGTYILVVPHENWASVAPRFKTPPEVLEEAFGRQEADSLNAMFNEAVDSVVSEIWQYRPDLSYIP